MNSSDPRAAYFDALAHTWDAEEPSARTMTERLTQHAGLLGLLPGQDLLEVGCGTGKTTAWLAAQVAPGRVTAVDFAPEMVARARAKKINADFTCLDVCSDDLGREKFDVVLCFHSFPHFRDQPAALGNFARSLRPAGRLIVMHLAGSEHINHFHANVQGPVKEDVLPAGVQWDPLLAGAHLRRKKLIDREDLFFLEAVVRSR
jgi:ubiquinone/menaquinone biosynthesis C-methylase UbiE